MMDGDTSLSDLPIIERSTNDPAMAVGYLYDARSDSVVGRLDSDIQCKKEQIKGEPSARMYKEENIKTENLLKILRIDDETRLITILKIIKPSGTLSIVNYSYLMDELTRLIYYFEPIEEESLIYNFQKQRHWAKTATHLITKMKFGISFVILLQLSNQDSSALEKTDRTLTYFTSQLGSDLDIERVISNEKLFLKNILRTKIYSNIHDLCRLNNICEVYKQLQIIRQNPHQDRPLNFSLSPIPSSHPMQNLYFPLNNHDSVYIEALLLPLSFDLKILKRELKDLKSSLLKDHLQHKLDYADQIFTEFEKLYLNHLETLKNSIIQIRHGEIPQETFAQLLHTDEEKLLLKKRDDVRVSFDGLQSKIELIYELQKDEIDYFDIPDDHINEDNSEQFFEKKFSKTHTSTQIFCTSDDLRTTNNNQWNELLTKCIESRTDKKSQRLVYADFSYSSYQPRESKTFFLPKKQKKKKLTGQSKSESNESSSLKNQSTINIVLFGESGVGKSTFINAFANYLFFENIAQARSEEPYVIIPVSFLMTINDQFEERLIQFGQTHSNENHNDLGQSVTQQCKSYELSTRNGQLLRIIDTPGFGDTRGQDQDEKNLNEIFSYLQNLRDLNALCILLKPNVKELNSAFKSSFRQILRFFGDRFHQNLFFCFTNSQSTFFTIGDTSFILNQFLRECQGKDFNLKKENSFCFDSESFRYLVASEHSIKFDQQFIEQFEQSWLKSVQESNRLLNQISLKETQKYIEQKWISIEQIQREINHLIRPILEALRNITRNIIFSDNETNEKSIQLVSIPLNSLKLICYHSDRSYKTFDEIYILSDYFHQSSDQCEYEHLTTKYELHYQFIEKKTDYSSEDANYYLYGIIKTCAHFDYFLNDHTQTKDTNGPFLSGINRMVNEEKFICQREESATLNKKLYRRLDKSKDQYYKDVEQINVTDEYSYLKSICSRIEGIKQMPMIYEQLNPVQKQANHDEEN